MSEPRCEHCRFWERLISGDEPLNRGRCQRFPPTVPGGVRVHDLSLTLSTGFWYWLPTMWNFANVKNLSWLFVTVTFGWYDK